jgi:predicted TIM-barrel fold metal-dependent hydrolase
VDEVAVDFGEVTFVICHIGNPWITDAMEVIYKNDNVVGDISGFTLKHFEERFERYMLSQVEEVIAFAGDRSKLLYGTDWPICDMGSYLRFVEKLQLSETEREQILWRNSVRVFHLDEAEIRKAGKKSETVSPAVSGVDGGHRE